MKTFAGAICLAAIASANATAQTADTSGVAPFIAQYEAAWKGMRIGNSEIQLTRGAELGTYMWQLRRPASNVVLGRNRPLICEANCFA